MTKYMLNQNEDMLRSGVVKERKRHVQQAMQFRTWGGKREGAGRPRKQGVRPLESHGKRPVLQASVPLHVVTRVLPRVGWLRRRDAYAAIRSATVTVAAHEAMRIVHLSIQGTHLHLIVEARTRTALAKGMQSFKISAAKQLNRALGGARGSVFTDRYHARPLRTPREVRNCIAYVLNNWRRHGEDRGRGWTLDPFASGVSFDGWRELAAKGVMFRAPPTYELLIVWIPKTWLLSIGWRRHGLVGARDVPAGLER